MTHIGIICPAESGHINTMFPLAIELKKRGHLITIITLIDIQDQTLAAGFQFKAIGQDIFPKGRLQEHFEHLGQLKGMAALKYTIQIFQDNAKVIFRDVPPIVKEVGIELLLIDQSIVEGSTVAEFLDIPFITICSAVVLNRDPDVPPFNTSWNYAPTPLGKLRNRWGYFILTQVTTSLRKMISEQRQKWGLLPFAHPNDAYSPLAQISQQPAELEFPRKTLPKWFYFTGPYHYSAAREPVDFPWDKLTGQPLIYASMGTLQNRLIKVFEIIAEACVEIDAQLIITLGGATTPDSLPELAGHPIVIGYAPQLELLQKASLTITHAGMNTTLESLTNGVPMVAIPVANDQPGIASRIAWSGAGEVIPLKTLRTPELRNLIQKVLAEDSYRSNAARLQKAIQKAGGVNRAVDIIEEVIAIRKPVIA